MAKDTSTEEVIRILAAVFLPPLGVFLQVGLKKHFWINVLLTILGYIPGVIHAVWVIVTYDDSFGGEPRRIEERQPPPGPPPTTRPHEVH